MGWTTLRQQTTFAVFFAKSPVDGRTFRPRQMFSRGVASIEQPGSGMQVTIAQESGPSPQFQDL
jgi:hypothetical protein